MRFKIPRFEIVSKSNNQYSMINVKNVEPLNVTNTLVILCALVFSMSCAHCSSKSDDDDVGPVQKESLANTPWPMQGHDRRHTCRSPYVGPKTATIKWEASSVKHFQGSPVIDRDGNVIVGDGGTGLFCFKPDGTLKWKYEYIDAITCAGAIADDGTIYFGTYGADTLIAINPDGSLKWKFKSGATVTTSPAIAPDGTIYIGGFDGCLHAVNPDGSLKWEYCVEYVVESSPAIDNAGTIYFGAWNGVLYALHSDGTLKWSYKAAGSAIVPSPAIGDDGIIYFSDRISLIALTNEGEFLWKFDFEDSTEASPGIGPDGTIYIQADNLYAFHPDGTVKWQVDGGGGSNGFPLIDNDGTVYFGSWYYGHTLVAINSDDGSVIWSKYIDDTSKSSPAIDAEGTLYVGTHDLKFYAFQDP